MILVFICSYTHAHTYTYINAHTHTHEPTPGEVVDFDDYDPNVVASLLKQYLREFPEPLVSPRITAKLEAAAGMYMHVL